MSYDTEELRAGIVELFDEGMDQAGYPRDSVYGGRPIKVAVPRLRPVKIKCARRGVLTRGINSIASWEKQIATYLQKGYRVCTRCGARSATHRCP